MLVANQIAPASRSGASYDATILADSPLFYLPMNESSGTTATDATGNGHNGTYSGGFTLGQTALTTDGEPAVAFNGTTGKVTLGTINLGTVGMTLELWVNMAAFQSSSPWISSLCGIEAPGDAQMALLRFGSGGSSADNAKPECAVAAGTVNGALGSALSAGTTYHIAGTYDGSNVRTFVNGTQVAIQAVTGSLLANSTFDIADNATFGRFCQGTIAKVAGYTSALSGTKIAAHYAAGTAGPSSVPGGLLAPQAVARAASF